MYKNLYRHIEFVCHTYEKRKSKSKTITPITPLKDNIEKDSDNVKSLYGLKTIQKCYKKLKTALYLLA